MTRKGWERKGLWTIGKGWMWSIGQDSAGGPQDLGERFHYKCQLIPGEMILQEDMLRECN